MTALPPRLRVRVVPTLHADVPVERLLVGLNLQHRGRTYYSTLLGLTDTAGELVRDGRELSLEYQAAQREFPMDYRLTLEECDTTAIVSVGGGRDFEHSRANALGSALVREPVRTWWREAQDQAIAEDRAAITLDGKLIEVMLRARRSGIP